MSWLHVERPSRRCSRPDRQPQEMASESWVLVVRCSCCSLGGSTEAVFSSRSGDARPWTGHRWLWVSGLREGSWMPRQLVREGVATVMVPLVVR